MITMNVNIIMESITLNSYIKVSRIMSVCISGLVLHLIHI